MIGTHVDHYRIVSQLGAGGMGIVYEAEDARLGRRVAVKFLPDSTAVSIEASERFEREARTLASLNHPNICTIHDIGAHDGRRYIVMELLDGESLRSRIHEQPLPLEQILDVGCQIADALVAAHAKGIVHRDIKPANILITRRGQAKLLDFGIAKLGGGQAAPDATAETRVANDGLTDAGVAVGSVSYMSPEQARGEETDGRTDLFALGLVLYEMATGRQAFAGQTNAVVFEAILNRQPADPGTVNPTLPDELRRVIVRALEKDRRMRFQTAADMLAELSRIRRDSTGHTAVAPTASTPLPAAPPAGRSRGLTLAAGLTVVALAGLAYVLWGGASTPAFAERDTVLVADFANATGDSVFDDALRQAVSVQLQQTPFVTLLADQQVQRTLRLMQREPDTPLTAAVARELCQRAGAAATVEGSIAPLGSAYVLNIGVHNCETGEVLAQQQVQAGSKEEVLGALGGAVTALRENLGESLSSIARYDVPVTEASTASLEALRAYGLAVRTRVTKGDLAAIPFFEQAIAIDPQFALAHAKLSVIHSNLGRPGTDDRERARTHALTAYELRDRVSEYERLYITWLHARQVTEDQQKAKETLELMIAAYPRDFTARNNLGTFYLFRADFDAAFEQFRRASEIAPDEPLPISNSAYALLFMGRRDEADAYIERVLAIRPADGLAAARWQAAVVDNDPRAAELWTAAEAVMSQDQVLGARAAQASWRGQLKAFGGLLDQRRALLRAARDEGGLAALNVEAERVLAIYGDRSQTSAIVRSLEAPGPPEARAAAAVAAAALGEIEAVRRVLPSLERDATNLDIRAPMTIARAYVRAADGRAVDAIADLEALRNEVPQAIGIRTFSGQIREQAGDLDGAAADYEAVIERRVWLGLDLATVMARVGLGRVRLAQGRLDQARAQFDVLLDQWQDADTESALLVEVRDLRRKAGQ